MYGTTSTPQGNFSCNLKRNDAKSVEGRVAECMSPGVTDLETLTWRKVGDEAGCKERNFVHDLSSNCIALQIAGWILATEYRLLRSHDLIFRLIDRGTISFVIFKFSILALLFWFEL